jgi:hypothetical protein
VTLSGSGAVSHPGSGALAVTATIDGAGTSSVTGDGALSVTALIDGAGSLNTTIAEGGGGGGGKRRRKRVIVEDDDNEPHTLEEALEREENERLPTKRDIQRVRKRVGKIVAQSQFGQVETDRIAQAHEQIEEMIERLQEANRLQAVMRLIEVRMLLEQIAADIEAAEQDDEEAILLLTG